MTNTEAGSPGQARMGETYVLDTSAIYNATDYPADKVLYSTPQVVKELRRVYRSERAELFVESRLRIVEPSKKSIESIRKVAEQTGDITRLSQTDIEVLSLAWELGAVLVTEDYSMQNISEAADIEFRSLYLPPIKEYVEWELKCLSCGAVSVEKEARECRICGGRLITRRRRSRRITK